MLIFRLLLLSFITILTFHGCQNTSPVMATLDCAQSLMEERPDSALMIIERIRTNELGTEEQRARYALLHSQALDKNFIDVDCDSLIRVAVDYYKDNDDAWSKFHAYYYLGRTYANAREHVKATMAYMEAEKLVDELENDYSAGLLYSQIGYIYEDYCDHQKALECHIRATECYEHAGKPIHKLHSMLQQSGVYKSMSDETESLHLLLTTLEEARKSRLDSVISICLSDLLMLCIDMDNQADAMPYYKELADGDTIGKGNAPFFSSLALLMAKEENMNMSHYYMEQAWKRAKDIADSVILYHMSSQIELFDASYEKAYSDLETCVSLQNKHVREVLQQPVVTAQKQILEQELESKNRMLRLEHYIKVMHIIIILLMCVVAYFLIPKIYRRRYHRKFKKKRAKWEMVHEQEMVKIQNDAKKREQSLLSYMADLENKSEFSQQDVKRLNRELKESREYIGRVRKILDQMDQMDKQFREEVRVLKSEKNSLLMYGNAILKHQFKHIEIMLEVLNMNYKDEKLYIKAVNEHVWNIIHEFYGTKEADQKLERMVNDLRGNAMLHLRQECVFSDEEYYRLTCMLLAGMSVNFIASIYGKTPNAIYKRKKKIQEIINASGISQKENHWKL